MRTTAIATIHTDWITPTATNTTTVNANYTAPTTSYCTCHMGGDREVRGCIKQCSLPCFRCLSVPCFLPLSSIAPFLCFPPLCLLSCFLSSFLVYCVPPACLGSFVNSSHPFHFDSLMFLSCFSISSFFFFFPLFSLISSFSVLICEGSNLYDKKINTASAASEIFLDFRQNFRGKLGF